MVHKVEVRDTLHMINDSGKVLTLAITFAQHILLPATQFGGQTPTLTS